jgi:hypothetical protein
MYRIVIIITQDLTKKLAQHLTLEFLPSGLGLRFRTFRLNERASLCFRIPAIPIRTALFPQATLPRTGCITCIMPVTLGSANYHVAHLHNTEAHSGVLVHVFILISTLAFRFGGLTGSWANDRPSLE